MSMSATIRSLNAHMPGPAGPAAAGAEVPIARSVLYASLFGYPLTLAQLRQTLIESVQTPAQILAAYNASAPLQAAIEYRDGFFFPRGRYALVEERRRREACSHAFLRRHRTLLKLVCAIPYARMVALSGSIAHLNLEGGGDLDLFIVTRGRHVWSVTVAVLLLAKLLRVRRIVCANFVVADTCLALEQQDLFTASQIIHLKPLIGREVYRDFVAANPFVGRLYPNFQDDDVPPARFKANVVLTAVKSGLETLLALPSRIVEAGCRWAYRAYLLRKARSWPSPEQVRLQPDCLKLHTHSHRQSILDRFDRTVQEALDPLTRP
jgi:hypothetical protein